MATRTRTEITRATAKAFMENLGDRRMEDLADLFGPEAHWAVVARTDRAHGFGGSKPGPEVAKAAKLFVDEFDSWEVNIVNIATEEDKAFVEGSVKGRGPGPKAYTNTYMMRFIVGDDGKITDFKEAMDAYEVEAAQSSLEEYYKQNRQS